MVKEQVQIKDLVSDRERYLAAHKSKAAAKFQQQIAQMDQQTSFELTLLEAVRQSQEVEIVRVTQDMLGHVGARRREGACEVG